MRLYLTGSTNLTKKIAIILRDKGHSVFDSNDNSNRLSKMDYPQSKSSRMYAGNYRDAILSKDKQFEFYESIQENRVAIRWCDWLVLCLPSLRDSEIEFGMGIAQNKLCFVVGNHLPDRYVCLYHSLSKEIYSNTDSFITGISEYEDVAHRLATR